MDTRGTSLRRAQTQSLKEDITCESVDLEYIGNVEVEAMDFEDVKAQIQKMSVGENAFDFPAEKDVVQILGRIVQFLSNDPGADWKPEQIDMLMITFLHKSLETFPSSQVYRAVFNICMRISHADLNEVTVGVVEMCLECLESPRLAMDDWLCGTVMVALSNALCDKYSQERVLSMNTHHLVMRVLQSCVEQPTIVISCLGFFETFLEVVLNMESDVIEFVVSLIMFVITLFQQSGVDKEVIAQCLKLLDVVLRNEGYLNRFIQMVPDLGDLLLSKLHVYEFSHFQIIARIICLIVKQGRSSVNPSIFFESLRNGLVESAIKEPINGVFGLITLFCEDNIDIVFECDVIGAIQRNICEISYGIKPELAEFLCFLVETLQRDRIRSVATQETVSLLLEQLNTECHKWVNMIGNALMKIYDTDPEYWQQEMSGFESDLESTIECCSDDDIRHKLEIVFQYLFTEC